MKLRTLLLIGFAAGIVGCAEKEEAAPQQESEVEPAEAAIDEVATDEPDMTLATIEEWRSEDLLDHMHAHAEHLDDLNFALDDGSLEQAMTSAYWLARHDSVKNLPSELQPFVDNMRAAARAVEAAEDLETAREAARKIGAECKGCHTATGVVIE